jgi:acyl carrier protein
MLTQPTQQEQAVLEATTAQLRDLLLDLEPARAILATDTLVDLGLNSLMLAQLLIGLESDLAVDPFGEDRSVADVRTVGDLVSAYAQALHDRDAA